MLKVETNPKKTGQGQTLTTNKKCTIFELSSRNLSKRTTSPVRHFDKFHDDSSKIVDFLLVVIFDLVRVFLDQSLVEERVYGIWFDHTY